MVGRSELRRVLMATSERPSAINEGRPIQPKQAEWPYWTRENPLMLTVAGRAR